MVKIEEIEQKLNEIEANFKAEFYDLANELAELKESKKEGKWKPELGEEFWYRTSNGETMWSSRGTADPFSEWKINNLPIFPNNEQCKRYWRFMDTVKEKSYEFSKEEWEDDDIYKYSIEYDYDEKEFVIDITTTLRYMGEIYFKSKEDVNYIIDNFKEELMEFFL